MSEPIAQVDIEAEILRLSALAEQVTHKLAQRARAAAEADVDYKIAHGDRLGLPAGVTSDECDAAWLRQIGLALLFDPLAVEVPKLHREALHKLQAVA